MSPVASVKFPTIDFSNLDSGWDAVKSKVYKALVEYGCFEALFDKVPLDILKSLLVSLEELFDLPLKTKLSNVSKKPYHGYVGQYPMVFESMGIDDADDYEHVESLTMTLWPQGNPSFSKTIQSFSEQLTELDQIIRKMVLESLGVEKCLEEHMNSTNYLLRVMKYKSPHTDETRLGLTSHTDKNVVIILYQNQVEGLEVQTKDGQWINYKPFPQSSIERLSLGIYAINIEGMGKWKAVFTLSQNYDDWKCGKILCRTLLSSSS